MKERISAGLILAAMAIGLLLGSSPAAFGAPQVRVEDDNFSADVLFFGPSQTVTPLLGATRLWQLRSAVDKATHRITHFLYVDIDFMPERESWSWADDDHAGAHKVERFSASRSGCRRRDSYCNYQETVGVELDDAFLRQRANGFQIKLSARSGDTMILTVTPAQIAPVLEAIDAYLGKAGPPEAAANAPNSPHRPREGAIGEAP